jgi:8-oxo-dGTP pyrophosphatase MutT (NUDIX family)
MANMEQSRPKPRIQYAALPFRKTREGGIEVLLVTSRGTQRWIVPKGWPIKGLPPHRCAEREAYEEAGVVGRVGKAAIGTYSYEKLLDSGKLVPCEATVFPLEVEAQRRRFPEAKQRGHRWCTPEEAANAVVEEGLSDTIRNFAAAIASRPAR